MMKIELLTLLIKERNETLSRMKMSNKDVPQKQREHNSMDVRCGAGDDVDITAATKPVLVTGEELRVECYI